MTLEQLTNPIVLDWIFGYNDRITEGKCSSENYMNDFSKWFKENESLINESIEKNKLNEEKDLFDDLFDDDDEEVDEKPTSEPDDDPDDLFDDEDEPEETKSSTEDEPTDDEPETVEDEVIEVEEDDDDDVEDLFDEGKPEKKSSVEKFYVDNAKGSTNIFDVVNHIVDIIERGGHTLKRITPLSHLDTSRVVDMTALLAFTNLPNVDLSEWDTRKVRHMEGMFYKSTFNNDSICEWKVYNCADFKNMFLGSKFNQSLSKWKPKKIEQTKREKNPDTGKVEVVKFMAPAPLPVVGAYEDEEKEMRAAFLDDKFKDFAYESKSSKYDHFMDFETFLMNEGFKDGFNKAKKVISKSINKVKNIFKGFALKVNNYFVSMFNDKGEILPVISPYTSLNYISAGNVAGVNAYGPVNNDYVNDTVKPVADLIESREYYDVNVSDIEKRNYETLMDFMVKENEKYNAENALNESDGRRVGLSAEAGGLKDVEDVDAETLKEMLMSHIDDVPDNDEIDNVSNPFIVWGAPGIGKSTIPNAVIEAYNKLNDLKEPQDKKSLFTVECGDLTVDGFALPIPSHDSFDDMMSKRPMIKKYADELGVPDSVLSNLQIDTVVDVPKTWVPCYNKDVVGPEGELLKKLANGQIVESKDGTKEERCNGGLLMFDEFLRADPSIFRILMQIFNTRRLQNKYVIGNKWAIFACSNRPLDDEEVGQNSPRMTAAMGSRFATQFNFVPDFNDWRRWAEKSGLFDEDTIAFLTSEKEGDEYTNWHTVVIEPGKTVHATPRSWTNLMVLLNNKVKTSRGKWKTWHDMPDKLKNSIIIGAIGRKIGNKFINWLNDRGGSAVSVKRVLDEDGYTMPSYTPAPDMTETLSMYFESHYGSDELPEPEKMINMFNFLDRSYKETFDNYTKQLHVTCIRRIYNMSKEDRNRYKEYVKKCQVRYGISKQDITG